RNADGGFGHFPGGPPKMDGVIFNLPSLIQAGWGPGARLVWRNPNTQAWGMPSQPGVNYTWFGTESPWDCGVPFSSDPPSRHFSFLVSFHTSLSMLLPATIQSAFSCTKTLAAWRGAHGVFATSCQ